MTSDSITKKSITIPRVGLGTYKLTGIEGQKSIQNALDMGYRHVDTAKMYENESEVGQAIRNCGVSRDNIFVTTKIWPSDFKQLISKTEDSLKKLKTDHIDLLLLHWPTDNEMNQAGTELLNEVLHKGYTKSVGVSNFNIEQLTKAISQAPVICNQVEYHPYLSQEKMLDYIKKQDLFLTAYRPLAQGKVSKNPVLKAIAASHHKNVAQIVLKWLIQQEDVAVIPKSSAQGRQQENLDIFDFELTQEEMELIFGLQRNERLTDPATAPKWD